MDYSNLNSLCQSVRNRTHHHPLSEWHNSVKNEYFFTIQNSIWSVVFILYFCELLAMLLYLDNLLWHREQMSDEEIMALTRHFFFSPLHSSHTVDEWHGSSTPKKKNTSQRSSSILNSVKWLIIDEVWSSWSCPSNKTNRGGTQWTQLMKHGNTLWSGETHFITVGALLKHKIARAHWSLN